MKGTPEIYMLAYSIYNILFSEYCSHNNKALVFLKENLFGVCGRMISVTWREGAGINWQIMKTQ